MLLRRRGRCTTLPHHTPHTAARTHAGWRRGSQAAGGEYFTLPRTRTTTPTTTPRTLPRAPLPLLPRAYALLPDSTPRT